MSIQTRCAAVAIAALVTAGSAACSSDPPPTKLKHGVLPAGTAHLTIDGADAGTTGSVQCENVGTATNIRTGDDNEGVAAQLSMAAKLTVAFVRIRNLNHFTGDYVAGMGDDAAATVIDGTYHVNGTASGYTADSLAPKPHHFALEAAC